ncbi:MAG: hypothetical protein ACRD6W_13035 [Nitrososphaerales archaeon]
MVQRDFEWARSRTLTWALVALVLGGVAAGALLAVTYLKPGNLLRQLRNSDLHPPATHPSSPPTG